MSHESKVVADIREELGQLPHFRIFRAHVGAGWIGSGEAVRVSHPSSVKMYPGDVMLRKARRFTTGLPTGFSDTFGLETVTVTPEMVGHQVAIFCAIEVKDDGSLTTEQRSFIKMVRARGGRAGIARSTADALKIISGEIVDE